MRPGREERPPARRRGNRAPGGRWATAPGQADAFRCRAGSFRDAGRDGVCPRTLIGKPRSNHILMYSEMQPPYWPRHSTLRCLVFFSSGFVSFSYFCHGPAAGQFLSNLGWAFRWTAGECRRQLAASDAFGVVAAWHGSEVIIDLLPVFRYGAAPTPALSARHRLRLAETGRIGWPRVWGFHIIDGLGTTPAISLTATSNTMPPSQACLLRRQAVTLCHYRCP